MTDPPSTELSGNRWAGLWAVGWVIAFLVLFFSFTLPNNREFSRGDVWGELPLHFFNLVDPVREDGAPASGWSQLPQRFPLLMIAALIHLSAWSLGGLVLRLSRVGSRVNGVERHVFACGLGFSALSLFTLGLGLVGWLNRPTFVVILVAATVVEFALQLRSRKSVGNAPIEEAPERRESDTRLRTICLCVITPFLAAMLLGSMLPSFDFDVKGYHLQGPKEFFQNGQIGFLPHNVYTSFPFLTEMLTLLAMVLADNWFLGALAGKAVLMGFAPLTAVAIFAAGRRCFGEAAAWVGVTIYLTTPWIYRISIIAYAEGGLTFFLFASLLATMHGIREFRRTGSPRLFLLVGLLAGSAMACKYTGVLQVVIPLGLVAAVVPFFQTGGDSRRWKSSLRCAATFALGTVITIGPWLAKNLVETGNPVYPLLFTVFGGADWDADLNAKWRAGHSPDNHAISDLGEKFKDVTLKSDWLSPLLFALAPLALLSARMRGTAGWLWLYVGFLFFAWWIFTHRIDRFWVPMIPVVAMLAGAGATWNDSRGWRIGCAMAVGVAVVFNLGFITTGLCGYNAYLIDLEAAKLKSQQLTSPEIHYLNRNLPENAKVLSVGDAEVFDTKFPIVYNTVFDRSIFQEWFAKPTPGASEADLPLRSAAAIRKTLDEQGITHVYVNWAEIQRYRNSYGYTEFVTRERFKSLQRMGLLGESLVGDVHPKTGKPVSFQVYRVLN